MEDRDTKGDVYEYMLGKIATAGQNGQFRTPRHIIQLMVEMMAPTPTDVICDPACGTCGFLVAAGEYLRDAPSRGAARPEAAAEHFHDEMFHGFDFDNTMLRIGSMNMLLHGVEHPDIRYRDSLAEEHAGDDEAYSLVLANPPFAGSLDYENTAKDLLQVVKTKKTELLFLALFLRLLKPGGRAAVIVPDGVLFGSTKAHKELRRILVEDQKLDGDRLAALRRVQALRRRVDGDPAVHQDQLGRHRPRVVLRPAGRRLQPRRQAHRAAARRQARRAAPSTPLTEDEHAKNNLPDALARWAERDGAERDRARTEQSFCVPKADIVASGYDLSLNRYKEVVYDEVEHRHPKEILDDLAKLEDEIRQGIDDLEAML